MADSWRPAHLTDRLEAAVPNRLSGDRFSTPASAAVADYRVS
jgi:hypothetical protein